MAIKLAAKIVDQQSQREELFQLDYNQMSFCRKSAFAACFSRDAG